MAQHWGKGAAAPEKQREKRAITDRKYQRFAALVCKRRLI
jgi:hypothetical protein